MKDEQNTVDQTHHPMTVRRRLEREDALTAGDTNALKARHRVEWDDHLDLVNDALFFRSLKLARIAKTIAETLRIRQICEFSAWSNIDSAVTMDEDALWSRADELLSELTSRRKSR